MLFVGYFEGIDSQRGIAWRCSDSLSLREFLLQATNAATLSAALISFGVHSEELVLGRMGDRDCYVFGGRSPGTAFEVERLLPSLWIDMTSYEPLRLARSDGTEYRLGAARYSVGEYLNHIEDAGFRELQWREFLGDASLAEEVPGASKYLGRPLLFLVQARRAA